MGVLPPVGERVLGMLVVSLVACLPSAALEDAESSTSSAASCGVWHPDEDGDGFGSTLLAIDTCNPAPNWVMDDRDCYDGNADVRPDQTEYFAVDRGDGGFDYDCDGFSAVELWELGGCHGSGCPKDVGWRAGLAQCGSFADYVTDCGAPSEDPLQCTWIYETRRQRCR